MVDSADETFSKKQVVIVSEGVKEAVYSKFIKLVWNIMLQEDVAAGGDIFESYSRALLAEKEGGVHLSAMCREEKKKFSTEKQADCVRSWWIFQHLSCR